MISYSRLLRAFLRKSFQQEAAFRFNFFINITNTILSLAVSTGGIYILFSQINKLNGWSFYQVIALMGIYLFIRACKELFIGPSLSALAGMNGDLWYGRFDFTLLKPVPTQFYVSVRNWVTWAFVDLVISIIILVIAIIKLSSNITMIKITLFLLSIFFSLLIVYSILLILIALAFWVTSIPLVFIYDSFIQLGRFPVKIYPGNLKFILTWIIPVGLIITVPAEILVEQIKISEIAGGGVFAVILFLISSIFFNKSLRKYSSASS